MSENHNGLCNNIIRTNKAERVIPSLLGKMLQKQNADFVMGYAFNLCKIRIPAVPYNHK